MAEPSEPSEPIEPSEPVEPRAGRAPAFPAAPEGALALPPAPETTTELGIDIVRVSRIRGALDRFGERFVARVCTPREAAYVRGRPATLAGRWAAKEAVSKVLGLGVRGIGWRDIEIERLPTGQPAVVLHGRAAARADQLGMGRIALSISHEDEFAVAIAVGVRSAGGRYVFPPDIEARIDERERVLLERLERMRGLQADLRTAETASASPAPLASGGVHPTEEDR
ncbi:MAG: holo-ACP synthase [Chloroflexota bacterium]